VRVSKADARIGPREITEYAINVGAGSFGPDQLSHDLASSAFVSIARAPAITSSCE
jgi:hypothetical protein